MCGIVGTFNIKSPQRSMANNVLKMSKTVHRGPTGGHLRFG